MLTWQPVKFDKGYPEESELIWPLSMFGSSTETSYQNSEQDNGYAGWDWSVLLVSILCVVMVLIRFRKRSSAKPKVAHKNKTYKNEMILMLNLARQYFELGEKGYARPLLNTILLHGSQKERDEANELMLKICPLTS